VFSHLKLAAAGHEPICVPGMLLLVILRVEARLDKLRWIQRIRLEVSIERAV